MKLMINGKTMEMCKPLTVTELLKDRGVSSPDMVSVEVNDRILDREAFDTTVLQESDAIEVFYFMGGGSFVYERYQPLL